MNFSGHQLAEMVGGRLHGGGERRCTGVSTDTRTILGGDLYVPLRGERFDGHDFVPQAVEAGAAGCLVESGRVPDLGGRVHVEVPDTLHALGEIARHHLAGLPSRVIGITGSNGKTGTKEMTAAALSAYGTVTATHGNHNNLIGLPLTAFRVAEKHAYAVLEMGMNRPGEIARLTEIAAPDVGVITSVAAAHLEGLHSIEGVAWAKGELFAGLSDDAVAVVNARDPHVVRVAQGISAKTVTVGTGDVDVSVEGIRRQGTTGFSAGLRVRGQRHDLRVRALGRHEVWNAALVAGVLVALDLDLTPGLDALYRHTGLGNRLAWKHSSDGVQVIDDTYNANPASVRAALETLCEVAPGRKIAVLGDMLELGAEAEQHHEDVGAFAGDLGIDRLFAVGEHAGAMARGYGEPTVDCARDAGDVAQSVRDAVRSGDWVLVKGSRGMRMERVVAALVGTGEAS